METNINCKSIKKVDIIAKLKMLNKIAVNLHRNLNILEKKNIMIDKINEMNKSDKIEDAIFKYSFSKLSQADCLKNECPK